MNREIDRFIIILYSGRKSEDVVSILGVKKS